MRRKLIEQGTCTLMVSLPRSWGKRHDLKKGDEVEIFDQVDSLAIVPCSDEKRANSLFFQKHGETQIRNAIVNAYRAGFDIIHIQYSNDEQYKWILDTATNYLIGLEVTKENENSCSLENITEPSHDHFDVMMRKLLQNGAHFISATMNRIKDGTPFTDYQFMMNNAYKYDCFCRRILMKQKAPQMSFYWSFLSNVLHSIRELYHLNGYLDKNDVRFDSELFFYFNRLMKVVQSAIAKKSPTPLEEIDTLRIEWYKIILADYATREKDGVVLLHVSASIRNLYFATSPLFGLLFNAQDSKFL